jgi:hypothetical protein
MPRAPNHYCKCNVVGETHFAFEVRLRLISQCKPRQVICPHLMYSARGPHGLEEGRQPICARLRAVRGTQEEGPRSAT